MTICFLSSLHPARDKRVFDKEAISLSKAGFRVLHIAPANKSRTIEDGVELITYRKYSGQFGRLLHLPQLAREAWKTKADCYHCNEVDSWMVGLLLKIFRRCRVIFDVHEAYPEEFAESRFPAFIRSPIAAAIRALFRALTPWTDRVILAKESVACDFSQAESKQVLVRNYVSVSHDQRASDRPQPVCRGSAARPIRAIHVGSMTRTRGWPQLLAAMGAMKDHNLELLVLGEFADGSRAEFDKQVANLNLDRRITVEDWLPFREAYERTSSSDIGLVLFQPGFHNHVHALPHKMFDYMLAGIPVVAPAFAIEVSRIISEAGCGVLVDSARTESIAEALDFLVSNPEERRRMGENGRRAVLSRYNWENEEVKLVSMYQHLALQT